MQTSQKTKIVPEYPTKMELTSPAAWLAENLPSRWQKLVATGGIAALFLAAGMGCSDEPGQPALAAAPNEASAPAPASQPRGRLVPEKAVVAPIFEHGEGRAATGCVVISPPVFMTEEEALQIIREELGKAGVKFDQRDVEMKEVGIHQPLTELQKDLAHLKDERDKATGEQKNRLSQYIASVEQTIEKASKRRPLRVDLVASDKRLAVEFLSQDDCRELNRDAVLMSTVQDYDFKGLATSLREQVQGQGKDAWIGFFYDPAQRMDSQKLVDALKGIDPNDQEARRRAWTKVHQDSLNPAREQLRQQVQDFAKWLKERGVI